MPRNYKKDARDIGVGVLKELSSVASYGAREMVGANKKKKKPSGTRRRRPKKKQPWERKWFE